MLWFPKDSSQQNNTCPFVSKILSFHSNRYKSYFPLCQNKKINNKEYLRYSLFLVFCYQNHFERFINQWITTLESTIQLIKLIKYFLCMYWDIIYPDLITLVSQKETKTNIISVDNAVFLNIIISLMNPKHKFLLNVFQ